MGAEHCTSSSGVRQLPVVAATTTWAPWWRRTRLSSRCLDRAAAYASYAYALAAALKKVSDHHEVCADPTIRSLLAGVGVVGKQAAKLRLPK